MTRAAPVEQRCGACAACLRRSWLLERLGAVLDFHCRRDERLGELVTLSDKQLLRALGGRRRAELEAGYARFDPREMPVVDGVAALCRHDRRYPQALERAALSQTLHVTGGLERFQALTAAPVVAIVGSARATDYGVEMAKSLGRGLALSGVTVASGLGDGIAVAVQVGALEAQRATIVAMAGGPDVAAPAKRRSLHARLSTSGCAVSELPGGSPARRWGVTASERVLAAIAAATVVVEAEDSARALAGAHLSRALGRAVGAVPGRVTSPASRGSHALLIDGARLIECSADVLELLYEAGSPRRPTAARERSELEPRLRAVLELVGAGVDTPGKLIGDHRDTGELLLALSELELMGLLARGDGGRYVPREPLAGRMMRYGVASQMES